MSHAFSPLGARSSGSLVQGIAWSAAGLVSALSVVLVGSASPPGERFARAALEGLIVGLPLATGLYAMRAPPTFRFGVMLAAAGLAWSLTALGTASASLPYSIGRVSAWLVFPLLFYLILAFPDGRLRPGLDRVLFGGVTLLIAVLFIGSALFVEAYPRDTPWATCESDCPANAFLVLDSEPAVMASVVAPLREAVAIVLLIGVTLSVSRRYRAAPRLRRRTIAPVMVMSIASTVMLAAYLLVRRVEPDWPGVATLGVLWSLTIPAVAAGFLVGLVRRRVLLGEALSRLSFALGSSLEGRELRATLATALDDPAVDVLVPDEAPGRWRDTDGRVTSRSAAAGRGLAVSSIDDSDGPVAALVHDPALDEEVVDAVRALLLVTVRYERLTTQLANSLSELEVSRKRIVRAADLERSRIERDLHDGAQQRLIGLRIKLSLAEELARTDAAAGAAAMHELGTEVEQALDELRSLAHGVYPSLLSDRGLADALRSAVSEAPLPVRVDARGVTRHPPETETAVYFTALEAVQNAIKHAAATRLRVSLRQNRVLRFEVRDDGRGFVPPAGDFSGGLRNMRDRIEAVGGRLTIDSAPGQGTRIRGVVPRD